MASLVVVVATMTTMMVSLKRPSRRPATNYALLI
jgi:hypothetical protein